jgi:ABC-type nitrate/sulfonate/bicarbonate transport system, ATPase component
MSVPAATASTSTASPAVSHRQRTRALNVRQVSKSFHVNDEPLHVLDDISFTVNPGEFVSILGASGCGKSTLLRLIVGLDDDYEGEIALGDDVVRGTSLDRGVVFQDHRLLPWLTVEENVGLGLKNAKLTKDERAKRVREHLALVGLNGFEKVFPYQLSGGMAQRVAIARGLVNRPELLLLDEPLGALDAITRIHLQEELLRIWRTEHLTTILVTHDVEEAIYLSDRIVILNTRPGRIKRIVTVPLSRPRDRLSHAFADIKREVLEEMAIANPGAPARVAYAEDI